MRLKPARKAESAPTAVLGLVQKTSPKSFVCCYPQHTTRGLMRNSNFNTINRARTASGSQLDLPLAADPSTSPTIWPGLFDELSVPSKSGDGDT